VAVAGSKTFGSKALLSVAGLIVALTVGGDARAAKKQKDLDANLPKPVVKIPLETLGYKGRPTAQLLMARTALLTVDFVDAQHVLFTYEYRRLLKRDEQEDDQGRMVRAEVVDLATGKITKQDDWRLHDADPYLWALGGGRFLLREGKVFYQVDGQTLEMKEFLRSQAPLRKVQAEEGTNLLTLETVREKHTKEEHTKLVEESLLSGGPPPAEDYEMYGVDLGTGRGLFREAMGRTGNIEGNETLLLKEEHVKEKQYLVSAVILGTAASKAASGKDDDTDAAGTRGLMALVSDCKPRLTMLGHDVVMVAACKDFGEHVFGVRTTDATLLWKHAEGNWPWPDVVRTAKGNRFAVQCVGLHRGESLFDSLDENDMGAGQVQVFDVDTGAEAFSTVLKPLYATMHAVALSDDGMRLAAVRDGALEVYDLPAVRTGKDVQAKDAQAKTKAAAKKDVAVKTK
jgi:hypothetical protein